MVIILGGACFYNFWKKRLEETTTGPLRVKVQDKWDAYIAKTGMIINVSERERRNRGGLEEKSNPSVLEF